MNEAKELRIKYISIILSVLAFVISMINLYNSVSLQLPKFSMQITAQDIEDEYNANRIIKIYNSGGQIVNPKVSVRMQLKLYCEKEEYVDNTNYLKTCVYTTEFTDFFQTDPYYDNAESAFVIYEKNATVMFEFLDYLSDKLDKEGIGFKLYSIQQFFDISYGDYMGRQHEKLFASGNNFDFIYWQPGDRDRYCQDNELVEIKSIPMAYTSYPFPIMYDDEMTIDEVQYVVEYFGKNCDTQILDGSGVSKIMIGKVESLISDERNLIVGVRQMHNNSYKTIFIVTLASIIVGGLIAGGIFFYKRKYLKRNRYKHLRSNRFVNKKQGIKNTEKCKR